MNCRDGRIEAAIRFVVVILVEPPGIELNMLFVGPCIEKSMAMAIKPL